MLLAASMRPIFGHSQRPRARHCHLQCFNAQLDPTSVGGSSQHFSSSSLLLVSVDGALTESGDCSDVRNVWYSSAHCTTESRRGTCISVGARVSRCLCGCDHVLAGDLCLSRDESVSRKRVRHTLLPSVHFSEPAVGMRSCPAFRGGTLNVRRNPGARILCWFLLQSRRWLRRHVKQWVQKFLTNARSRLRRHVGQWSRSSRCMHTLWCLLVSASVPRMRLCSSLSVVAFLCCATFDLRSRG